MKEIFSRRSIRKYSDKEISNIDLKMILKAGMNAPTARNLKPFEFIIIKEKGILEKLSITKKNSYFVKDSNTTIIIIGNELSEFWQQDLGAVTQNILLEATYLNIGSCWIGIAPNDECENYIKNLLNVPKNKRVFCMVSLGYPAETKEPNGFYDENKIHYNRYSN